MIHSELAKAATKEIQRCVIEGRLDNAIESASRVADTVATVFAAGAAC